MNIGQLPATIFWLAVFGLVALIALRVVGKVGGRAAANL